jgi:hypothetical protein
MSAEFERELSELVREHISDGEPREEVAEALLRYADLALVLDLHEA